MCRLKRKHCRSHRIHVVVKTNEEVTFRACGAWHHARKSPFIMQNNIYRMKVPRKYFILWWRQNLLCRSHRIHVVLKTNEEVTFRACGACQHPRKSPSWKTDLGCHPDVPGSTCESLEVGEGQVFEVCWAWRTFSATLACIILGNFDPVYVYTRNQNQ